MSEYVSSTWFSRRTRKINGQKYNLVGMYTLKQNTLKDAKKWRETGYNVRIIPEKMKRGSRFYQYGFWVYRRRK